MWLSKLLLPATSFTISQTFRCEDLDGGRLRFLVADRNIDCNSDYYTALWVYAGVSSFTGVNV